MSSEEAQQQSNEKTTRTCAQCRKSQSKENYSKSQWSKGEAVARCKECTEATSTSTTTSATTASTSSTTVTTTSTSLNTDTTATTLVCSQCKCQQPKDNYSKSQWAKGASTARCKSCVTDSTTTTTTTTTALTTTTSTTTTTTTNTTTTATTTTTASTNTTTTSKSIDANTKNGRVLGIASEDICDGFSQTDFKDASNCVMLVDKLSSEPLGNFIGDTFKRTKTDSRIKFNTKCMFFSASESSEAYNVMSKTQWICWWVILSDNCADDFISKWNTQLNTGCFTTAVTLFARDQKGVDAMELLKKTHDAIRHSRVFLVDNNTKATTMVQAVISEVSDFKQTLNHLVTKAIGQTSPTTKFQANTQSPRFSSSLSPLTMSITENIQSLIVPWKFLGENSDARIHVEAVDCLTKICAKFSPSNSEISQIFPFFFPSPRLFPFVVQCEYYLRALSTETFFYRALDQSLASDKLLLSEAALFRPFIRATLRLLQTKSFATYSGEIFRGISTVNPDQFVQQYKVGDIVYFNNYISATKSLDIAQIFSPNIILKIVPQNSDYQRKNHWGHTNFDISGISAFRHEQEVLYPPLTTFHVKNIEKIVYRNNNSNSNKTKKNNKKNTNNNEEIECTVIELSEQPGSMLWTLLQIDLKLDKW